MFCEIPPNPPGWGPKALKALKAIQLALLDDSPISMTVVPSPSGDGLGQPPAQTAPAPMRRSGGVLSRNRYSHAHTRDKD